MLGAPWYYNLTSLGGLFALAAASLATLMTGCVAGLFCLEGAAILGAGQ